MKREENPIHSRSLPTITLKHNDNPTDRKMDGRTDRHSNSQTNLPFGAYPCARKNDNTHSHTLYTDKPHSNNRVNPHTHTHIYSLR